MERLAQLEEHEVGDIHQIVLGMDARGTQAVLHPLGRRADLAPLDRDTRIAGRRLGILHDDLDRQIAVVDPEGRHVGPLHLGRRAVGRQVGRQIAGHADVRCGVHPIGRQPDADQIVVLDPEILPGRHADPRIGRQLHDALVRRADAQLVLGAKHAERLDAADLAALDLEPLVAAAGVEHRADGGAQHLEARTAVGGSAHDRQRFARPDIDFRDMQVVRIGMILAREYFAHHDALQAAPDGFDLFETFDFETDVGQYHRDLFGRKGRVEIAPQPVVRDIHIVGSICYSRLMRTNIRKISGPACFSSFSAAGPGRIRSLFRASAPSDSKKDGEAVFPESETVFGGSKIAVLSFVFRMAAPEKGSGGIRGAP